MFAGASPAFALIRIKRGDPMPSNEAFLNALNQDRALLSMPAVNGRTELETAGPYAIMVDGADLDEYVVWER